MQPLPLCLLALGLLSSCAPQGWREADIERLAPRDVERLELARDATADLGQRLMAKLTEAIEAGGPAAAIAVCKELAPRLAADVGKENGMRIGRTSFKRRNPRNLAPAWATSGVNAKVTEERAWLGPDGRMGYLRPIPTAPQCLQCHGGPDDIEAATALALRDAYPEDMATGFAAGDVRGYFFVEFSGARD